MRFLVSSLAIVVCLAGASSAPAEINSAPGIEPPTPVPVVTTATLTITRPIGGFVKGLSDGTNWAIHCGKEGSGKNACSVSVAAGTSVELTAVPDEGNRWIGWSGVCEKQTQRCTFAISGDLSVLAYFTSTSGGTTY